LSVLIQQQHLYENIREKEGSKGNLTSEALHEKNRVRSNGEREGVERGHQTSWLSGLEGCKRQASQKSE
jgi:hypothetical protein